MVLPASYSKTDILVNKGILPLVMSAPNSTLQCYFYFTLMLIFLYSLTEPFVRYPVVL